MKRVNDNTGPLARPTPHANKVFIDSLERIETVDPMVYAEQLHFTAKENLGALTRMSPHVLSSVITEEEAEEAMSNAREVLRIIRQANQQRKFDARP